MRRSIYVIVIGVLSLSLAGCVTVEKVVRDRVDQDMTGNQGYIQGRGPGVSRPMPKSREYVDIKVEVPTWEEVKERLPEPKVGERKPKGPAQDRDITGNQGYITRGKGFEEGLPPVRKPEPEPVVFERGWPTPSEYEKLEGQEAAVPEEVTTAARTYKVKEGDSLSRIAKDFYGKASKWTIIYEANPDKIKDPNRIKAGTMLTIPEPKEAESESIK